MNKKILASALAAMLFSTSATFAAPAQPVDRETINQIALLQSLTLGYFDGSISVKNWKKFGDTGIGTFEGLDGEMIVLDGVVYRANVDCKINVVADNVTVPFSNVTFFDKDFSVKLNNVADKAALEKILNAAVEKNGVNSFYMIKIKGNFDSILVRSESGQKKPYPTLVQALKDQNEKTLQNINGTIVGLYCPNYMAGLNSAGWHFHFVDDTKTYGGHVLQLKINSGTADFDKTENFAMRLPNQKHFNDYDYSQDLREDIRKAENDTK